MKNVLLQGMKLGNFSSCSFDTGLELICGTCDEKKVSSRKEIACLTKKLVSMEMDAKNKKQVDAQFN